MTTNSPLYDYIIIGGGICGCSIAHELYSHTKNILLIDKNSDVAKGASGAAGAFLSPLLGKPNSFKDLVNESLIYATKFYKDKTPEYITNCGTVRIPKNKQDIEKFDSYKPYMEFPYEKKSDGFYFPIGSVVDGYHVCKKLMNGIETLFDYTVTSIKKQDDVWIINNTIKTKKLIVASGADISLLDLEYVQIRPVWGQRIDIETSTEVDVNYHKECSVSLSKTLSNGKNKVSIGATHHRFVLEKDIDKEDNLNLLKKANDIIELEDINIINEYAGARACSVDYFPFIGDIVDSKATLEEFPHMRNGSHINSEKFSKIDNLYIINGVGGRGYVLAPLLAKYLSDFLISETNIDDELKLYRFFTRWVKKSKKT